jgi:integrase
MAERSLNRLTARQVETVKLPGKHADGGGLYLLVDAKGRRSWLFFYTWAGKRVELGLGSVKDVSLASARKVAATFRHMVKQGDDPRLARERAKEQQATDAATKKDALTFGGFADQYIATHEPSWRNAKHAAQWRMTLTSYAAPIRHKALNEIATEDVLGILQPHWQARPETAMRLRGRIESVLDAAKAKGLRSGENPARWRGHLDQLLPKRQRLSRGHHRAMPYADVPAFMAQLSERPAMAGLALQFLILTASRTSEVLGARWNEIDLKAGIWTVPASRMKAGNEHRVPLSARCIAILESVRAISEGGYVFPGTAKGSALSIMSMTMLLRRMNADCTVHGFRSCFRDWAAETTGFPHEVCEMALAHTVSNKVEAAYRRGDLFDKRRELMNAWANYLELKEGNVVSLQDRRA